MIRFTSIPQVKMWALQIGPVHIYNNQVSLGRFFSVSCDRFGLHCRIGRKTIHVQVLPCNLLMPNVNTTIS